MAESKITKNEYRKLLWENPHPSSGWIPSTDGDITLSSDNYDYLEFEIRITGDALTSYIRKVGDITINADIVVVVECVDTTAIANNFIMGRIYKCVSRTKFTPTTGMIARWGASSVTTNDRFAIPIKIYGIKY